MNRILAAVMIALVPALSHAATLPSAYTNTVVFGDSLSDNGFFGGQATDGDVWAGQLGITFDSGRNYAVGGARAIPNPVQSDFQEQIGVFTVDAPVLPDYSQAVVWFGGNDLLNLSSPAAAAADIQFSIMSITLGVANLAANFGIDRFVIPGLPDFAQVPRSLGDPLASAASFGFNQGLQDAIGLLNLQGIDARYVDIAGLVNGAQNDPAFTNTTGTCVALPSCDGYLFWDDIHPTGAAHALVAQAIAAQLEPAPIPLPAGAPLVLSGLLAFGALRMRRKIQA